VGIEELLRAARVRAAEGQSDGQLLGQFLARRDEEAFAVLVARHGPMVLAVCRRILGHTEDAEDAFQAAFLVLVRKAASLTARAVLGDWLHGVARRTALNAKRTAARRRVKEQAMARPEMQGEEVRDDRLALLDEALSRLPEKYRLAIVLCELEGRTRREAAERLGWPEGTVAGRLARGRALLAKRLVRRGLALSAASMASLFSAESASAGVPASLALSTIKAAARVAAREAATMGAISAPVAALVEGVLKTMLVSKLKSAVVVLAVTVLVGAGGAAGVLAYLTGAETPKAAPQTAEPKRRPEKPETSQRKRQTQPVPENKAPAVAEADKEDRIRPGDLLTIRVQNPVALNPIQTQVEASGKIALGPGLGRVYIKGLTLEEAEQVIQNHLAGMVNPETGAVLVTRPIPDNPALERRVQQLESEVRALRSLVGELQKKTRD
jgi:RNA polymerase sigma factor (sigma-70 family)